MKSRNGNIWCRHFEGIQRGGGKCEKGIVYKDQPWFGGARDWPCHGGSDALSKCSLYEPHTKEEIEARDKAIAKSIRMITEIRPKIVQECIKMGWGKHNEKDVRGAIACPECQQVLYFRRSAYNGHIHAHCETKGCVSWME